VQEGMAWFFECVHPARAPAPGCSATRVDVPACPPACMPPGHAVPACPPARSLPRDFACARGGCGLSRRLGRDQGTWTKFDANGEKEVEKAFQKNLPTAQSSFFNPRLKQNIVYQYDLNAMTQVPPPALLPACPPARPPDPLPGCCVTLGALILAVKNSVSSRPTRRRNTSVGLSARCRESPTPGREAQEAQEEELPRISTSNQRKRAGRTMVRRPPRSSTKRWVTLQREQGRCLTLPQSRASRPLMYVSRPRQFVWRNCSFPSPCVCVCVVCVVCVWLFRRLWLLSPARVPSAVPPAAPKLLALLRHTRARTHTHHLPGIATGQRRHLLHLHGHLNPQP
jgi:hypothetical protein